MYKTSTCLEWHWPLLITDFYVDIWPLFVKRLCVQEYRGFCVRACVRVRTFIFGRDTRKKGSCTLFPTVISKAWLVHHSGFPSCEGIRI